MTYILDYSNWRPTSPQALKAAGVVGVLAYIKPTRFNWPKAIKANELVALINAGIAVGFNYENNPGDWRGGYNAGRQNGAEAAEALAELGVPLEVPVYVSYDEYINPSSFAGAAEYLRGFRESVHREVGIYGEGALIEALSVHYGWLSESTSFPGSQAPTAHTVVWQHYGQQLPGLPGAYDVNTIHATDWGQYPRPTPAPVPVPEKVKPMYRPALTVAGVLQDPKTHAALAGVGPDGSIFAWGIAFRRGMNGNPNFIGREAAQLVFPNAAEKAAGKLYTIIATSGERYAL